MMRKPALILLAIICFCLNVYADQPIHRPLKAIPFTSVQFKEGFWKSRLEINRTQTVWHNIQKCEETGRIENFAKAGGLKEGEHQGIYFNDSDLYKVLEGAAYCLHNQADPVLDAKVDEIIHKITSAQQDDGYLFSFNTLKLKNDVNQRWRDLKNEHELYCAGHMFEAAVAHYRATGKKTFLEVAIRLADHICSVFGPNGKRAVPGHEEIELALIKLYELTGQKKYFDMACFFLKERGNANGRKLFGSHFQDHKPIAKQEDITGHAVRAMYLYSGVADMVAYTGEKEYLQAMDRLWESVTARKMYITGGIGVQDTGEGFNNDYVLPNAQSYAETCASIGLALWSHRLSLLYGDADYFDVFERVLFNGLLSGVSLDGRKFFYVNLLESDKGKHKRLPWYGCACCPTNIVRFVPSVGGYIYAADNKGLYVNLYAANDADINMEKGRLSLSQETRYPWDGKIKVTINPESAMRFTLRLRIPGWCRNKPVPSNLYHFVNETDDMFTRVSLKINGNTVEKPEIEKGYFCLERKWQKGDVIELILPMPVRRVGAHPNVKADDGRVALQRGPIVFCLEEQDNGTGLGNLHLPDDSVLTAEYREDLLGGVVVLKAKAIEHLGADKYETREITAIPYYSWDNRKVGRMITWLLREAR